MAKQVFTHIMSSGYGIQVTQHGPDKFDVQYGKSTKAGLDYAAAAAAVGEAIFHSLACTGELDNAMKGQARG